MQYVVDKQNRIVDVDADWDIAASGHNGSPGVMRARILGQPLERFLAGDATKMFVRAAFDAARLLGETKVLPYRCDSPTERRRFHMEIRPLDDGQVQVTHRLVLAEPRQARSAPPRTRTLTGWRCSQCMGVRRAGSTQWVEADGYVPLAQDVCPACAKNLFDQSRPGAE